ncbi:hypothetical protein HK100_007527, partial [Physocladia obscura]
MSDVFGTIIILGITGSVLIYWCIYCVRLHTGSPQRRREGKEKLLDYHVKMQANQLQRQQKLQNITNERAAHENSMSERIQLVLSKEQSKLDDQRHKIRLAELRRDNELKKVMENAEDERLKRNAARERAAIELRAAKHEEKQKISTATIKVIDNVVIENGVASTTKHIQRERIAATEEEATRLIEAVSPELQQIHQLQRAAALAPPPSNFQIEGDD